ncbi:MAG TPA: hypothetical protein DCQ98_07250 [Planctomycetaceae bacterium]|nr:hypothetical protein [Planctomycetaceae bacterium]
MPEPLRRRRWSSRRRRRPIRSAPSKRRAPRPTRPVCRRRRTNPLHRRKTMPTKGSPLRPSTKAGRLRRSLWSFRDD